MVTDLGIKAIAEKCSMLRALNLKNLWYITDIGMGYLAEGCSNLLSSVAVLAHVSFRFIKWRSEKFKSEKYLNKIRRKNE